MRSLILRTVNKFQTAAAVVVAVVDRLLIRRIVDQCKQEPQKCRKDSATVATAVAVVLEDNMAESINLKRDDIGRLK